MKSQRVFGLDVMRAVAILLVVYWHNADVLSRFIPAATRVPAIDGVDLFFVLSGYLIGGILLKYADQDRIPWWRRLLDFWQRRWLRTLPNYYLFLVINVVLVHFGLANGVLNHNTWGYALFLQYVWKPVDLFFWESWSLVVEEWYYLLFPLMFFGALAIMRSSSRTAFLLVTVLLIVASTAIRHGMTIGFTSTFELEEGPRKLMVARLDTLGFGMFAVWLATGFQGVWRRWRFPLLVIGLTGVITNAMFYGSEHLRYSCTWFFTVNAVSMAALLPALSTWKGAPRWGRPIVFISVVSYSLYLVHQPLRSLFNPLFVHRQPAEGLLLCLAYWVICLALAWLVQHYWETRFMALRERVGQRIMSRPTPSS